ncbi:MAG: Mrp/NBP35 family ATP-binding protein [Proteobacteria bacterium]|nr:Mrp/NBP35 family ATP-binding protein [Pseudomonadota bacterium]
MGHWISVEPASHSQAILLTCRPWLVRHVGHAGSNDEDPEARFRQIIGEVEWGELDYLIIDSPPGTGDEPLTVAQTIPDAKAVIVTTPQEISLADVRKSISFCRRVSMEILGVIENMSGFTCPHCSEKLELFGYGGGERTAKEGGLKFLGRIPFDQNVVTCCDSGSSFQEKYKDSQVTKAFLSIADIIAETK